MPRIFNRTVTCVALSNEFTAWSAVGTATSVNFDVELLNGQQPDLWVQWSNSNAANQPEPESQDVFTQISDVNGHAHLVADIAPPGGAFVRVKATAADQNAMFRLTINTS